MNRLLRGTQEDITVTFYVDGVPTNADATVTVTLTRADGTVLVTSQNAASTGTTGEYRYALTSTQTSLLDTLTASWTATLGGQAQTLTTTYEIVGGFYFALAELRAIRGLTDTTDYPTSALADMRTTVEDAIEEYTGALVPRYSFQTVSGVLSQPIRLDHSFVRTIRSVSVDGVALAASDLANLRVYGGMLSGQAWNTGFNNVTIGYEHGLDAPPQRIRRAAVLLAKVWLINGPVDDRTNTFTSTDGGTYSLVTPGRAGSLFGVPEVDAAVSYHRLMRIG